MVNRNIFDYSCQHHLLFDTSSISVHTYEHERRDLPSRRWRRISRPWWSGRSRRPLLAPPPLAARRRGCFGGGASLTKVMQPFSDASGTSRIPCDEQNVGASLASSSMWGRRFETAITPSPRVQTTRCLWWLHHWRSKWAWKADEKKSNAASWCRWLLSRKDMQNI